MRTKTKIAIENQKQVEERVALRQEWIYFESEQVKKRQRIYRFIRDNYPIYYNTEDLQKLTIKIMNMMGNKARIDYD